MIDIILAIIVSMILIAAIAYIFKEKKKGNSCIGCPHAGNCSNHKRCN